MTNVLYTHSDPAAAPLVIYNEQDNCYAMKIEVPVFEKKRHEHTTVRRVVNRDTGYNLLVDILSIVFSLYILNNFTQQSFIYSVVVF